MVLIPIVFFLIFKYWPMFGLSMAFQDYKVGAPFIGGNTVWVGFKWFEQLFTNRLFSRYITNTLLLSIFSLIFSFPINIALALLLNEIRIGWLRRVTSNITLLPHFISTVIVVGIMSNLFSVDDGIVNILIVKLGGKKINFMASPEWFRPLYIGSGIWQNAGFNAVVFTAAIAGIDPALYEAAAIDGSSRWKNIYLITLPCIAPTIITMLLLRLGSLMSSGYEKIILMYSPSTYKTADTLATYSYRAGILDSKMSLSTTVGLFNSICNLILLFLSNRITRRVSDTYLF